MGLNLLSWAARRRAAAGTGAGAGRGRRRPAHVWHVLHPDLMKVNLLAKPRPPVLTKCVCVDAIVACPPFEVQRYANPVHHHPLTGASPSLF